MVYGETTSPLVCFRSGGKSNVRFKLNDTQHCRPFSSIGLAIMPSIPSLVFMAAPVKNRFSGGPFGGAGSRTSANAGSFTKRLQLVFHQSAQREATSWKRCL